MKKILIVIILMLYSYAALGATQAKKPNPKTDRSILIKKDILELEQSVKKYSVFFIVRDNFFLENDYGKKIYYFYYTHSPLITSSIEKSFFADFIASLGAVMISVLFMKYFLGFILIILFIISIIIILARLFFEHFKTKPLLMFFMLFLMLFSGLFLLKISYRVKATSSASQLYTVVSNLPADNEKAATILLKKASKSDTFLKYASLRYLFNLDKKVIRKHINNIAPFLRNEDSRVRYWAMLNLARTENDRIVQLIIPLLNDENLHLRSTAATILQIYRLKQSLPFLYKRLEKETQLYPYLGIMTAIESIKDFYKKYE